MRQKDRLKPLLKVAAVLAGLVSVAGIVRAVWSRAASAQPVALMCVTPGCGYHRQRALRVGQTLPLACPRCGHHSLAPAFCCPKCGTSNVWNEDRNLKPPTRCTRCGQEVRHGP